MRMWPRTCGLAALAVLAAAPAALSEQPPTNRQLRRELERVKAQVAELRAEDHESWLNEQRKREVQALVKDVLSDAETRASLAEGGMTAGHDGSHFFLKDPGGNFYLELAGHVQFRYNYVNRDSGATDFIDRNGTPNNRGDDTFGTDGVDDFGPIDGDVGGFTLRRAKFKPEGWITAGDRKVYFNFNIVASDERSDDVIFETWDLSTPLTDNLTLKGGRWKQPFALQNLTSSSRQLAVDRSVVHETFAVDRSEGVGLYYETDRFSLAGAVNDGREAERTRFDEDDADVAVTGRAEWLLAGEWSQFKDPATAWSGEPTGAMLGAGLHYEAAETGTPAAESNFLLWTTDLTFESNGFGLMLAGYGHHSDHDAGADFDDFGFLAEGGYFVVPDTVQPFLRYEMIVSDDRRPVVRAGANEELTNILTAGVNWYQARHNSKFTLDVVYFLDPNFVVEEPGVAGGVGGPDFDEAGSGSLGLRPGEPGEDGTLAVRAQYQMKF